MINALLSESGFVFLLSLYATGALGSLFFKKKDALANMWLSFFAIVGSLWGVFFSIGSLIFTRDISFAFSSSVFPLLSFSFHIDMLSAFFIFVISLIALFCSIYGVGYIQHFYKKYSIGAFGFFYHLFLAGMIMVVSASNAIFFLMAWEIMSIASYFLVIYDRNDTNNVKAGFIYLVMTHIGTVFIILAFLLLSIFADSGSTARQFVPGAVITFDYFKFHSGLHVSAFQFDFESIRSVSFLIPAFFKNVVFVLFMIGFGTKAGIIPFHIWLPSAHPAAPSHVSALMSGVMIKTGIYMMIRMFFDILQPVPLWWGITILIIGSVSALLGVLYALTEHDIKRLLAYHSIENIGIILLGFGSALIFSSLGNMPLALFGLGAALFHTLNHATFKSLLFLSAGSVIHQTHTRNMEKFGGLIKYMPRTAFFFLVGSMAISALPPFNGFFSEWMTFQTLLQGMASSDVFVKSIFVLAAGSLALTGGLALACFVKAFGATFLARPRSQEVIHAKESSLSLSAGMVSLSTLCLLFGIFSGYLGSLFVKIGADLNALRAAQFSISSGRALVTPSLENIFVVPSFENNLITQSSKSILSAPNGFDSVSAPMFFTFFVLMIVLVILLVKFAINKHQKIRIGSTWDCGVDLTPRMEITATGFARSIVLIFAGILRPSIQHEIEYHDSETRYLPKSRMVSLGIHDVYQFYFYQPLSKLLIVLSLRAKTIQSGNINLYIFYILIAVVATLFFSL